jgi:hypothetical protein
VFLSGHAHGGQMVEKALGSRRLTKALGITGQFKAELVSEEAKVFNEGQRPSSDRIGKFTEDWC